MIIHVCVGEKLYAEYRAKRDAIRNQFGLQGVKPVAEPYHFGSLLEMEMHERIGLWDHIEAKRQKVKRLERREQKATKQAKEKL